MVDRQHPNLPEGFRETLVWKLSGKLSRLVVMQLLMIPMLLLCGAPFFWLASRAGDANDAVSFDGVRLLGWIAAIALTLIAHELVHGAAIRLFGAPPRFGILWQAGAFYATADGYAFPRNRYLVIALAPLVLLSLVFAALLLLVTDSSLALLLAIGATLNAAGALGDLWISAIVLRYPAQAYVVDEKDGMRIFVPEQTGSPAALS